VIHQGLSDRRRPRGNVEAGRLQTCEGNPDNFWDVYLRHTKIGWLIDGYGQG
jgi:hypothetical protein